MGAWNSTGPTLVAPCGNKSYLTLPMESCYFLFDFSEFRSKWGQMVAYIQSFTEQLPGLKSHSNAELKTIIPMTRKNKIILYYLESKFIYSKVCLRRYFWMLTLNKSDGDFYVFKGIWTLCKFKRSISLSATDL